MTIWFVFLVLTAGVLAVLAVPFLRRRTVVPERAAFDRAVYVDQLAEVERDRARGTLGDAEAEAARNEIARRLIRIAAAPTGGMTRHSRLAAMGLLLVPAVLPLYLLSGSPKLPDVPLQPRLDQAVEHQDYLAMIARVEQHLAQNPGDVEGWKVLAPAYQRLQRWSDAAQAYANIMRLSNGDADTIAAHGEMLVFANEGMVTAAAQKSFAEALRLDPKLPKARFFEALALKQEGKTEAARLSFAGLLADSPAGASWRPMLEAELKALDGRPAALTSEQLAAGESLSPPDRQAMIRSMVDGLEAKLKADAGDLAGWHRLIRARSVLLEPDKAKTALAAARQRFKDTPEAIASLASLAREVGLE